MAHEHQIKTPPPPPKVENGLEEVLAGIRKRMTDPGIIYNLHDKVGKFKALSSGVQSIDDALCGGLPEGRIVELYGPEGSGKTTVMLHFVAEAQKRGEVVYFIDAENALDVDYAKRIGVDLHKILFSQPDYGEQALDVMRAICESIIDYNHNHPANMRMRALIVLDSVAALVPRQEFEVYEKEGLDHSVAMSARARMLSSKLPIVCNKAAKSGVSVVFINQMRDKVNVTWGSTTTTPGGRALKFFASVRISVARIGLRNVGGSVVGIRSRLRPEKSKLYSIFDKSAEFYIGEDGIDQIASLAEECVRHKVVTKSGAWVKYGELSFQGATNFEARLREDSQLRADLEKQLVQVRNDREASK